MVRDVWTRLYCDESEVKVSRLRSVFTSVSIICLTASERLTSGAPFAPVMSTRSLALPSWRFDILLDRGLAVFLQAFGVENVEQSENPLALLSIGLVHLHGALIDNGLYASDLLFAEKRFASGTLSVSAVVAFFNFFTCAFSSH